MLLMMGGEAPETCWATHKRQAINLWNCCILSVDLFESYDDARTCERQKENYVIYFNPCPYLKSTLSKGTTTVWGLHVWTVQSLLRSVRAAWPTETDIYLIFTVSRYAHLSKWQRRLTHTGKSAGSWSWPPTSVKCWGYECTEEILSCPLGVVFE